VHVLEHSSLLTKEIRKHVKDVNHVFLDGEMFAPPPTKFHTIQGAVSRSTGDPESLNIRFHVYDMVDRSNPSMGFEDRLAVLRKVLLRADKKTPRFRSIQLVPTTSGPPKLESLNAFHARCTEKGYEGAVFRTPGGVYKERLRSKDVLKHKTFHQEEYRVLSFVPQQGNEHMVGAVELSITKGKARGKTFKARPAMTDAQRTDLMKRRAEFPGQWATVTFFEVSKDGIPRHPVLVGFRGKVKQ
jgi:ATP-dependent DNA ligase